jgi:hypothetical protein
MMKTGVPAGWSGRSTKGRRAMIFGAFSFASRSHHRSICGHPTACNMPRSPPPSVRAEAATASIVAPALVWTIRGTVNPK